MAIGEILIWLDETLDRGVPRQDGSVVLPAYWIPQDTQSPLGKTYMTLATEQDQQAFIAGLKSASNKLNFATLRRLLTKSLSEHLKAAGLWGQKPEGLKLTVHLRVIPGPWTDDLVFGRKTEGVLISPRVTLTRTDGRPVKGCKMDGVLTAYRSEADVSAATEQMAERFVKCNLPELQRQASPAESAVPDVGTMLNDYLIYVINALNQGQGMAPPESREALRRTAEPIAKKHGLSITPVTEEPFVHFPRETCAGVFDQATHLLVPLFRDAWVDLMSIARIEDRGDFPPICFMGFRVTLAKDGDKYRVSFADGARARIADKSYVYNLAADEWVGTQE